MHPVHGFDREALEQAVVHHAARAGAASVLAAEPDANGRTALRLNAALNGVEVEATADDLLDAPVPEVDTVLAGDLFYDRETARRVTAFLGRCVAAGRAALVGDPGRAFLPIDRLSLIARYEVADVGTARNGTDQSGLVFAFSSPEEGPAR